MLFYLQFDDYFCDGHLFDSFHSAQPVCLPYNRLQVNAELLPFFVWSPKRGGVLIFNYEKGRLPRIRAGRSTLLNQLLYTVHLIDWLILNKNIYLSIYLREADHWSLYLQFQWRCIIAFTSTIRNRTPTTEQNSRVIELRSQFLVRW